MSSVDNLLLIHDKLNRLSLLFDVRQKKDKDVFFGPAFAIQELVGSTQFPTTSDSQQSQFDIDLVSVPASPLPKRHERRFCLIKR